jgi:hypothetical protein
VKATVKATVKGAGGFQDQGTREVKQVEMIEGNHLSKPWNLYQAGDFAGTNALHLCS